jgi:exonuclease V gamma subunit
MPATLHFSNSLDALADRLIEGLSRESNPFAVTAVATPGAALRDWLKIRVAERKGVAAGLSFPNLESLLWDRLAERDRHRDAPDRLPARQLDDSAFKGLVLAQLRRDPPADARAYLDAALPEDAARRHVQLAGLLASLFREYEYNRVAEGGHEGVTESWMRGVACFERDLLRGPAGDPARARRDEARELEAWQMAIYRALFREGDGLRDRWGAATKVYRYTLPQYARLALGAPTTPPPARRAPVFRLFGLSNVSPFHRDLIGQLADEEKLGEAAVRFEIYALNPCAEFWEDALSLKERRARERRKLKLAPVPRSVVEATRPDAAESAEGVLREEADENGLLALLGKPGRETIKLWCRLTDHDFKEDFHEPKRGSLLSAVRASVLHRAGPLAERFKPRGDDASLRIRRAPDPYAEIEAVRKEVAERLQEDSDLRPEDCAILVANPDEALPILRAVFAGGAEAPGNAPALLPAGSSAEESPLLRGLRDMLALGCGPGDRNTLLAFLDNPAAWRRAGLGAANPESVERFLEAAGCQEGWDAERSGLPAAARRALWAFALDGEDPALRLPEGASPWPADGVSGLLEREEAAALLDWIEALREDTRPLRDGNARSFPEWARILRGLSHRFLQPGPEDARAELELRWFLDDTETWGRWGDGDDDVSIVLFRAILEDRFRGAEGPGRTALLRGGIRAGSLAALRGLPFRHVWITGLSTEFPAARESAPLDLRAFRRLAGESDPAARDLYALLEILACTTDSLSLSWPDRGNGGTELQPSRALTGIAAWLESDVLPEGAPFVFGEMKPPPDVPPPAVPRRAIAWAEEPSRRPITDWRDLDAFLQNPAAHAATKRFRAGAWDALEEDEEERAAALFLDRREDAALLDPALRAELIQPGSGAGVFGRAWDARERGGRIPPGPYGGIEGARLRAAIAEDVARDAETLRGFMAGAGLRFAGSLRLGPQDSRLAEAPVLNLPAFDASSLGSGIRVGGILPWFFLHPRPGGGWALLVEKDREFPAYLLQACAALESLPEPQRTIFTGPVRLFVRDAKKGAIESHPLPAIDPESARAALSALFGDYSRAAAGEGHLDDLPLAQVEAILRDAKHDAEAVDDWTEALRDQRRGAEESSYARSRKRDKLLRAIGPEIPEDAEDAIRRRVLPYLDWKKALYGKGGDTEDEA